MTQVDLDAHKTERSAIWTLAFCSCSSCSLLEFFVLSSHDAEMQEEWSLHVRCYTDLNFKNSIEKRHVEVMLNFQGSNLLFPNTSPKTVCKIICPFTCP